MISNLNGSGSVRVHRKKAAFTGSRFRFGRLPGYKHVFIYTVLSPFTYFLPRYCLCYQCEMKIHSYTLICAQQHVGMPVTRREPAPPPPPCQNFGPPVRYRLLCLLLYLIINDTVLKMCTGNPYALNTQYSGSIQVKTAVS